MNTHSTITAAASRWTTATKRSWPGSPVATNRRIGQLARRHLPVAVALARRVLGNAADAEDVAQDAMLRVWTNAPRWQPLALFRTWFRRIVVNLCLDRKRRARWVDLEAAGDIVDPAANAGEQVERGERDELVRAAIAQTAGASARGDRAHL